jgi:hypothetical protein
MERNHKGNNRKHKHNNLANNSYPISNSVTPPKLNSTTHPEIR